MQFWPLGGRKARPRLLSYRNDRHGPPTAADAGLNLGSQLDIHYDRRMVSPDILTAIQATIEAAITPFRDILETLREQLAAANQRAEVAERGLEELSAA